MFVYHNDHDSSENLINCGIILQDQREAEVNQENKVPLDQ